MPPLRSIPADNALVNGPLVLGSLFAVGLYGVLVVQLGVYFLHFPRDRQWLKCTVLGIFVVETIITVFVADFAWISFVSNWGNPSGLAAAPWSLRATFPLTGIAASTVHAFFCWRIRALGHFRWPLLVLIMALSFAQLAFAVCTGIADGRPGAVDRGIALESFILIYGVTFLASSAACDSVITATMLYFLLGARRNNFKATNSLLLKLIMVTIGSGLLTSTSALTEIVLYVSLPNTNLHSLLYLMLSKIYSNTMLTSLNARRFINETQVLSGSAGKTTILWEDQLPTESSSHMGIYFTRGSRPSHPVMHITQSTAVDSDHPCELDVIKNTTALEANHSLGGDETDI